ncbi:pilus assembly protein TadC [Virgibacillus phasianinus]|uniref:Pilus assembly protein TadC n=1 Tax=Virgibacillus phasianinus TaxID=2017483 RepID=A0A220U235_9BACI|nr:type II secretion system F family protein [Virgibacillus phasianinus]ASK61833.1 pilus assembly protein TadC [Virgibacillus phasianinus]
MISIYFVLCSAFCFMLVIGAVLSQVYKKQIAISNRAAAYFGIDEENGFQEKKRTKKGNKNHLLLMKKISDKAKGVIDQRMPATKKKELEQRLREAGYPLNLSSADFRFLQFVIGVVLFVMVYALLGKSGMTLLSSILLAGILSAIGMYYPSFYLSVIIKKRRYEIQKKMPDFFDMVTLSIEAGMGLDASLQKVCNQMKGPLSDEFQQTLEDMRLGKSRREALADLRSRVPVHQFQSIITSLIQADMLGVGMAKVLRSLTLRIREQRTQLAREQAMKAPVKMVFPMLLFIFPAIFIVLLGPLIIYLLQTLL